MKIKCGRREFEVTERDRILDNGACYILITQKYFSDWSQMSPTVAKTTFNKLLKGGKIKLSPQKYKIKDGEKVICEYDLYQFVKETAE